MMRKPMDVPKSASYILGKPSPQIKFVRNPNFLGTTLGKTSLQIKFMKIGSALKRNILASKNRVGITKKAKK